MRHEAQDDELRAQVRATDAKILEYFQATHHVLKKRLADCELGEDIMEGVKRSKEDVRLRELAVAEEEERGREANERMVVVADKAEAVPVVASALSRRPGPSSWMRCTR